MSAHVLLNFCNELGKRDKMRAFMFMHFISLFFATEFNKFNNTKSTNVRFYLSYHIKITLKSHFCYKML